jgi:hypothetical protein
MRRNGAVSLEPASALAPWPGVYVRQAWSGTPVVIGAYPIGRITGKASLPVGSPGLDHTETVQAVLFVANGFSVPYRPWCRQYTG